MKSIDTATLRASWRDVLAEARTGAEAFVILQHGRPEAVLLSEAEWLLGGATVPVLERDQRCWAASDVRSCLRAVRTAAHMHGRHTLIRKPYGSLFKDGSAMQFVAVIAPYEWVRQALPELRDGRVSVH
ncbi:type II toxin-antitoxin system Phd/YefM family antitoxin [Nocardia sp. CA-151230]|uniref:type II toxin-antitoxin system Phd/YefM family antitoxin n=1 Tax=Nocardia sp. CA-151230 TaxID=3239982 RepID=UPI003D918B2C